MKKRDLYHFLGFWMVLTLVNFISGCSKGGSNPKPANNTSAATITSLSVSSGPYFTNVTITGTGFSSTAANDHVFFNGVAATFIVVSSTSIQTSVPLAAGTGPVTVTVNGKTATGPTFTYQTAEVVTLFAGGGSGTSTNGTGTAASFSSILALAADISGNVFVADQGNNLIRKITPAGVVTTFAGSGSAGSTDGTGTAASFNVPSGVATDAAGNVYVADKGNGFIRKITPGGQVSTLTVNGTGKQVSYGSPDYVVVDGNNNVFFTDLAGTVIREISPSGEVTTAYTEGVSSNGIYGMVLDKTGNFFTIDESDNQIDKISSGSLTVFAGNGSLIGGAIDGTGKSASFYQPWGLAIDANGNLFVNDRGNSLIREITPAAVVTTFAGRDGANYVGPVNFVNLAGLDGITVDPAGNLYVAENGIIRKISFQ
jgi:sugar lactone lactonase YvrE